MYDNKKLKRGLINLFINTNTKRMSNQAIWIMISIKKKKVAERRGARCNHINLFFWRLLCLGQVNQTIFKQRDLIHHIYFLDVKGGFRYFDWWKQYMNKKRGGFYFIKVMITISFQISR